MIRSFVARRRWFALVIGIVTLAAVVLTSGLVAAQTATPTPSPGSTTRVCTAIGTKQGGPLADLLTALVNEGIISQDQAERIRTYLTTQAQTRCLQGQVLPPADILSTTATKLGITVSQLGSELRQGKSLAQVASDHGVSRDDLKSALLDTARKNADALVEQGVLTQDQANQALQAVQNNLDTIIDQVGLRGFKHGFGWGRGWHHDFRGNWDEVTPNQSSSNSDARSAWRLPIYSQ